jgi:taurine dioxygenase
MGKLEIRSIDKISIGTEISGVNLANVHDQDIRSAIGGEFGRTGLIVFKDMEPSDELQVAVSGIIGPPQEHALKQMNQDPNSLGLIELSYEGNIVEERGVQVEGLVPWHFDACYSDKLNRGAILRALVISPIGGMTGFVDGVQLYNAISPELKKKFEGLGVIYHPTVTHNNQRFGKVDGRRWISLSEKMRSLYAANEQAQRAVHPAIWERASGEKVLHVSPWQAVGIWGHEDKEGNEFLETLCQEIFIKMQPYWHQWGPNDMVLWDNWRFIHAAGGNDPKYRRSMRRTTIKGDYGLGAYESDMLREQVRGISA